MKPARSVLPLDLPRLSTLTPLIEAVAADTGGEVIGRRASLSVRGEPFPAADPIADHLLDTGMVLGENASGHLIVDCPWSAGHTTGGADAAWLPAGTGGVERGHFHCFHASCAHRSDDDFLEAIGLGVSNDFDALPPLAAPADGWTLPTIDTTCWINAEPPEDRWIVPGWLMRGTAALLVGEDGVGKSLLAQQLCTAVAANRSFIGLDVVQVPSLYITCEDKPEQLWKRQRAINYALGLPINCAPAVLSSLVGHPDVHLGHFDNRRVFVPGAALRGIAAHAKAADSGLIVLDNLAHFFTGNENVRQEVAAFCSALEWLAIEADAAVVLLAHPNKAGAEYSGSTGWSAHVRQRWYMDRPRADGLPSLDPDARILRKSKANYSSTGDELAFHWVEWAFRRLEDMSERQTAAALANHDDAAFVACLTERTRVHQAVSEKVSSTYAPKIFAAMPESLGAGQRRMEAAMDRLLRRGLIERALLPWKRDRKDVFGLRLTCADRCADAAPTGCADVPDHSAPTAPNTHLPLKGETGAALRGLAPSLDQDGEDHDR